MGNRWPILTILLITLLAFYPVFGGKVPLNARNLVSFFSPWYYQKFEGFPAGVPSKPGMLDQIRLYYPYMRLTQESYRLGELPLWNPYNFAGNPHMAEWQSGVFYPLHIFLIFLPLPVYWTLYQMSGFFLVGWFMFVFLRNLKLRRSASLLGAASFMLSSFMTTWNMEVVTAPHSILWMPLILLAVDKIVGWPRTNLTLRRALRARPQRAMVRGSGVPADPDVTSGSGSVRKTWWLVGLGGLVMSILSGYWQTTFYVMAVSLIYAIYRIASLYGVRSLITNHRSLIIYLWFPLALVLTAFQLLPTWELYHRSSRPYINLTDELKKIHVSYLLPTRQLVTLLIPDYYGHPTTRNYFANIGGGWYYEHVLFVGTIPLMLAISSLFISWRYNKLKTKRDIWFWWVVAVVAGSFSFNLPWAKWVYQRQIPVLSTGIANRVLFVSAFSLSVLSAFGLDFFYRKSFRKAIVTVLILFWLAIVGIAAITYLSRSSFSAEKLANVELPRAYITSIRNSILPLLVLTVAVIWLFLIIRFKLATILAGGIILLIATGQNLYQHHKFTAFSESQFIYPSHPIIKWLQKNSTLSRFSGYNGQFINSNFATYFGIYAVDGYDSLNDYRRTMLVYSPGTGNLKRDIPRAADANLDTNLSSARVLKLMKLLGIRYLVERPEWLDFGPIVGKSRLPQSAEKLVFKSGDWKIWEYLDAYPRAFLVGNYEVVNDGQEMIDRLYSEDFNPLETLLLSEPLTDGFDISVDETGSVSIEKYTPTKMIFKTKSNNNQLLFLSDTYYPGWWYRVDNGGKQPVLAADYALRAVPVPAGEHTVIMWYFPDSFRLGVLISLISMLTGIGIASLLFFLE